MRYTKKLLLAVSAYAIFCATSPAYAQENQAQASSDDSSAAALDEIVVTAQRRAENLQKVPIVVTTVTGEQLAKSGVNSLQQVNLLAPGLNSKNNLGAFQPSIRGVGTTSQVVENPVALYIDGVYLPQQREGLRELPDVEQIAVLKGPQGTLFGRNATGGVIQITTKKPTQDFGFQGRVGYDNYETFTGSAFVTGGLAEGIAGSLSVQYAHQDQGYGTNLLTGNGTYQLKHSFSARGKLLFEPGPDTEITLIGDYLNRAQNAQDLHPYPGTLLAFPVGPTKKPYDLYSPFDSNTTYEGGGVSLTVDHNFGPLKLLSISAYRKGNATYHFDNLPTSGIPYFDIISPHGPNNSFTQEIQFISNNDSNLKWNFGVYYYHSNNEVDPIRRIFYPAFYVFNTGSAPGPTRNRMTESYGHETAESLAPFGQVGIKVLPDTTLTLGFRYNTEKRSIRGRVVTTRYDNSTLLTTVNKSVSIERPTWRIALDQQITPDILGYISFNRGIKSGGYNINSPSPVSYDPETLDAYEAGLKMELLDRRLRLNIGGFYYNYSNLQVSQYINNVLTIVNGPKATLYGLDVDFDAKVSRELRLSGGFELMHNAFGNFPNAPGSVPKPAGGATLLPIGNAKGNHLPAAQNFVGTLAVDYTKDLNIGKVGVNITANYNGKYYFEVDNRFAQPAYVMLNASLTWTSANGHYSASVWGRNLADKLVATLIASQAGGYTTTFGVAPRTYGVTAGLKF